MKKSLAILLFLFVLANAAKAQTYKSFKLDIDLGGDVITSPSSVSVTIEPHYRFNDRFALGLRFQTTATAKINLSTEGANSITSARTYNSNCLSADYYFTNKNPAVNVQFFAGGGVGIFTETYDKNNVNISTDNFGFFPRIGLETGHFRASIEYNVSGGTNNYLSINAGFFFGGGKK